MVQKMVSFRGGCVERDTENDYHPMEQLPPKKIVNIH